MRTFATAVLLITSSAVAHAQPVAAAVATAVPAVSSAAPLDQLMDIILPTDRLVAQTVEGVQQQMGQRLDADPNIQKLENYKPGLKTAILGSMKSALGEQVGDLTQRLRSKIGVMITARLTPDEILTVRDFYMTPTGQRLLLRAQEAGAARGMQKGMNLADQAIASNKSPVFSTGDVQTITNGAAADAMKAVEADDIPALQKFGATSAASKMAALSSEMAPAMSEELNAWITAAGPLVQSRIRETIDRHMKGPRK